MDQSAYLSLRDSQEAHWWFVGRRMIVRKLIERYAALPKRAKLLEAGCGYGGNLRMLGTYGDLHAFEYDSAARAHASMQSSLPVEYGCLPEQIGFGDEVFDLIALLDVLEHIDDDVGSLIALRERLSPRGSILLTVPAVPFLWSEHDVLHHHKRRYSKTMLQKRLKQSGLEIIDIGYFNSLLFPLALAQRLASRFFRKSPTPDSTPPGPLNRMLETVFTWEARILPRFHFPIGLSLYAIARQKAD